MINSIKLKLATLTKGQHYVQSIVNMIHNRYLGHHKIIDWRDGCPVYSTLSPPPFSKPEAYRTAMMMAGQMQNRAFPVMANIAVTDECNMECHYCSFKSIRQSKRIMTTDEIKETIRQVQDLGVCIIAFVDGEPLLRKDIYDIIKSVDKNKSTTALFTNGAYLEGKAKKLKESGLDSIIFNGSYLNPDAIKEAREAKLTVAITQFIDEKTLSRLKEIMNFAKNNKVNEVLTFEAIPVGGCANRDDLKGEQAWIKELLKITKEYNNNKDYPAIFSYFHTSSHNGNGCSGGTMHFYISPYGDLMPCDFNPVAFGNVLDTPLHTLWDRLTSNPDYSRTSWQGCKLRNKEYREEIAIENEK